MHSLIHPHSLLLTHTHTHSLILTHTHALTHSIIPYQASSSDVREDAQLVSRVLEAVTTGRKVEEALGDVTEQLFFRIEVQLIKAAVASGNTQVCTTVHFYKNVCSIL